MRTSLLALVLVSAWSFAQPVPPAPPQPVAPPAPPSLPGGPRGPGQPPPPMDLPPEVAKKVQEARFEADEAFIGLEADVKRAHLALERALSAGTPDDAAVMAKLEAASKAELAAKKNRMGLQLKVRKLVGPEAWARMQAAEGPMGPHGPDGLMLMMGGPRRERREVRIIRGDGAERVEMQE